MFEGQTLTRGIPYIERNVLNHAKNNLPKRYLQNVKIWYNKSRNEKPQTWFASVICKKHIRLPSLQICFFIGYCCLLKIIQIAIIKEKAMIVNPINETKRDRPQSLQFKICNDWGLSPFVSLI